MASNSGGPTVFISYAHENDALRGSVKALADWLCQKGCVVLTDHPFADKAPPKGWTIWMRNCVKQANIVLIVCTPKLKARFEKDAPVDEGQGATYEGSIVTRAIYEAAMRNEKFFPIVPDGGIWDDVPDILRDWWNNHRFPSGNERIRRMIFHDPTSANPSAGSGSSFDQTSVPTWPSGADQARLAARLLEVSNALPFFEALQREFADEFQQPSPTDARAMVQWFAQCLADQVQQLFFVVRRALQAVPAPGRDLTSHRAAEEAAAALYFVAACRLVDQAARAAGSGSYVLHVPRSERIVCAVIATALFGGELRLVPSEQPELPSPEYVFEVKVPAGGDQVAEDFERAAYAIVMANDRDAPEVSMGSGRLGPRHSEKLAARIRTIRSVRKGSLALVVHGLGGPDPCEEFGTRHQIPVMLPATVGTTELLGMDAGTLLAEIQEFWSELQVLRRSASPPQPEPSAHPAQGAQTVSSSGLKVQVSGGSANISISTGEHSVSQAGAGSTADLRHEDGAELAPLYSLLRELMQAIGELGSPKAREALAAQAMAVQAEAAAHDKPDPRGIKLALDAIRSGAEVLEDGGRIITLCNKAYQILAPFLGLPPSPLP